MDPWCRYWCVLKRQTLLLLDKPPALNVRPQLCLKILVLPSVTVRCGEKSFSVVAPDGEQIVVGILSSIPTPLLFSPACQPGVSTETAED